MENWRQILLKPAHTIKDALAVLDATAARIVLVVDDEGQLLGTVTDGDIRRSLLAGNSLEALVAKAMNCNPTTVSPELERAEALRMMNQKGILHLPIRDALGRLIGMHVLSELLTTERRENHVVLMAGGEGRRLHPITRDLPKPMIPIGGTPILETIMNSFLEHGFYKFYISLNYLGEQIREYFGDGSRWGAEITYLEETEKRGTAGCLSLLPEVPQEPLFVMNGDLLTKVNFKSLLDYHTHNKATATMCVREYAMEIPFGVVEIEDSSVVGIEEKPVNKCFINSGIYLLDPQCLQKIPETGMFDMTTLFEDILGNGKKISSFPIFEYWMDIGRIADLDRAHKDFNLHFSN